MALVLRVNVAKHICNSFSNRLCKVPKIHNVIQAAFLSGKSTYVPKLKPPPYPYWEKKYGLWDQYTDFTLGRMDENSKIIVVDGNLAIGKSKLCEAIAEEFNMLFMPPPTFDDLYTHYDGTDVRAINKVLPASDKLMDLEMFWKHPKHPNAFIVPIYFFLMRLEQYCNALVHLLSTGQGVVLNRSVYSDPVFVEALHKAGYISKSEYKYYTQYVDKVTSLLLPPHAVIYLDAPVNVVMDKIKQRGIQSEINSPVVNEKYVRDIEEAYKTKILKSASQKSYLLCYDWSKGGNVKTVFRELEDMPLEVKDGETRLSDWALNTMDELRSRRWAYQNKFDIFKELPRNAFEIPSSIVESTDTYIARQNAMETVLGEEYKSGECQLLCVAGEIMNVRLSVRDFVNRKFGPTA